MLLRAATYAAETVMHAGTLSRSLGCHANTSVNKYLTNCRPYSSAAMGTLGTAFYDIATGEGDRSERQKVRRNSSRLLLLTDIVDDIIDSGVMTNDQKCGFLDRVHANLFGYDTHRSNDVREEASYHIATLLYEEIGDGRCKMEPVFDNLGYVIKQQFEEEDPEELLKIAKTIGAACTDSVAVITEIVTGSDFPGIREAARRLGEYCELLDNWFELDNDLAEGVNTFLTVLIRSSGDGPVKRKRIKNMCLSVADDAYKKGVCMLPEKEQRETYNAMKFMIDVKYRIATKLSTGLLPSRWQSQQRSSGSGC